MQTAQITVKYINPPKGKGPASVKDATGKYWKFWTREIPLETFAENGCYTIGYKTEKYNDQDQFYIQQAMENGSVAPAAATPKVNGHSNGKYQPTDNATSERIFVCGALNAAVGAGKVDVYAPDELVSAVEALRSAYQATFGK